ncbi:MAG TPA: GDP-mannose 4,6-dehydratase [bacterium]|nr:GDP-mannose 4,6-dehydratase [bacterium]
MEKILLTGCCGFIASKVAEKLLEKGYFVFGLDEMNNAYDIRLKQYRLQQLEGQKNFRFLKQDISEPGTADIVRSFMPSIIINLAARAGVRASMDDPFIYFRANLTGTLNMLEAAKNCGIKKFVLASTSSVYAGEEMPFSESLPVNRPISPYAASKKSAEVTCYTYHYLYDMDITVFRYFTVYGPAGRPDMSIFKFIKLIDEEKEITVYGNGTQSRNFTYVDDIAEGTIRAPRLKGFNTVNLGGNQTNSLNELISLIEKYLGKKARIVYKKFQKTDIYATWADIDKAKKLLGWQPETCLEKGVMETIEWYKQNYGWLKDVELAD